MYEKETYESILERMLNRVSDKLDKRPSSVIYDTHSAAAIELQLLYIELEYLIKNSYGDTAAREYLILLAKDRGLAPETATKAVLKGVFAPADIDVTGKRFNIGDMNYVVTQQMLPGQYQVQCETAGTAGNQYLGDMMPIDYIDRLQTAQLTEILIPGEDDEDTEAFRQRYFDSFNERSFAGNQMAYLEAVKKIDGVGDLKVTRVWNGDIRPAKMIPDANVTQWYDSVLGELDTEVAAWLSAVYTAAYEKKLTTGGTVLITVVNSLDFGEATDVLLDKIQTELDPVENAGEGAGLAPIGHVVQVKSAEPVAVDIKANVTFLEGYNWSNTQTRIQEALSSYLLELRKEWADSPYTVVRIRQIETRILGVKGVLDIADTKINGSADNLTLTGCQIPVPGGVSI
ncbi:MAG: baseplate J/gp47 family protein [Lachnospiraceae bacterium]|nr:baseplate J/gp47 family protein [Lachnospiraceae bacterium]